MAGSIGTQWEFAPDGSENNGGGFDPVFGGVDYSRQPIAQLAVSDGVGTGTTTLSSAVGGFTALMVGNWVTQAGVAIYQIRTVTDANHIVVDRATGTFTGATLAVGGARAIGAFGISGTASAAVAGNKIWVRGTNAANVPTAYTVTSQVATPTSAGLLANPIVIEGYGTVRGDGQRAVLNTSFTGVGGSLALGTGGIVKNLAIIDTSGTQSNGLLVMGDRSYAENVQVVCKAASTTTVALIVAAGDTAAPRLRGCLFDFNGSTAGNNGMVELLTDSAVLEYCTFTGGTQEGLVFFLSGRVGTATSVYEFRDCVFSAIAGAGVTKLFNNNGTTNGARFSNCVFWGNSGDVAQIASAEGLVAWAFQDCIFGLNAGFVLNYVSSDLSAAAGALEWQKTFNTCNLFYDPGSGGRYKNLPANPGDTTLLAVPFTNPATGDFSLNGVAGGGPLVTATLCTTSFPTAIPKAGGANTFTGTAVAMSGYYGQIPAAASTVSLRSLWRELTNEPPSTAVPDSRVDIYLDWGLQYLNRIARYHYTTDAVTVALVAGQQEYTAPPDLIEAKWLRYGFLDLRKGDLERWRGDDINWANEPTGEPREWAQYGQQIILRPAPSAEAVAANATCTLRYVSNVPSITTNGAEQLPSGAWRIAVMYGAALWSISYPDTMLAQQRAEGLLKEATQAAQLFAAEIQQRAITL